MHGSAVRSAAVTQTRSKLASGMRASGSSRRSSSIWQSARIPYQSAPSTSSASPNIRRELASALGPVSAAASLMPPRYHGRRARSPASWRCRSIDCRGRSMPAAAAVHSLRRAGRDIDVGQEVAMKVAMAAGEDRCEAELLQVLHTEFGELRSRVDRLLRAALDTDRPLEERACAVAALRDLARFAAALERMRAQ